MIPTSWATATAKWTIEMQELLDKVLGGGDLTEAEVYSLLEVPSVELREAAARVTARFCPPQFDSCSIVNARSGLCSENCKWCAQSAHYHTTCETYDLVDEKECMELAHANDRAGIRRFSLVASGKRVGGRSLTAMCDMLMRIRKETSMTVCASMGLLTPEQLQELWDAGVHRYHCNLETCRSLFPKLCTTHTIDDKLETIRNARRIGFEICSGGIIGMGETRRQRAEFALTLREAEPDSIPVNILSPIPGTPLQDTPLISEDEILDAIAIMRLAHPRVQIRFAGGRSRLSRETQLEAMRIGVNGGIMGDMLTTLGSTVARDKELIKEAGYKY